MKSPRPNRLGMYADVRAVLDAALAANGGTFALDTHGRAVHWRQRAYKFRKLFAETTTSSPYDALTLPVIPDESSTVVIRLVAQPGIFTPADPTATLPAEPDDELLATALNLAKDL